MVIHWKLLSVSIVSMFLLVIQPVSAEKEVNVEELENEISTMMSNQLRNFTEDDNVEYGEVEDTLEESTLEEYNYEQEIVNAFKEEAENIKKYKNGI